MSEHAGEKTEAPTQKKIEDAVKHGNIARSAEVQTAVVIAAGYMAIQIAGKDIWDRFAYVMTSMLSHLHDTPLAFDAMQDYAIKASLLVISCVGPIVLTIMCTGVVAGAVQNRFQTSPEALDWNWERLNPVNGFGRVFSAKALVPALLSMVKISIIGFFSWSQVNQILHDPIFYQAVDASRIAGFMAGAARGLATRVLLIMATLAGLDYVYQQWKHTEDLRMTRQEVKDEAKQSDGNPQMKSAMRKRRKKSRPVRKQLEDVPTADVIVVNPTHIAIALRYERGKMRAPIIVAKGIRMNAQRIREIAEKHQVPVVQNVPLARMMFKYGRVGGEVPSQLYSAVAEVLAYVYRINRYRYHSQQLQSTN